MILLEEIAQSGVFLVGLRPLSIRLDRIPPNGREDWGVSGESYGAGSPRRVGFEFSVLPCPGDPSRPEGTPPPSGFGVVPTPLRHTSRSLPSVLCLPGFRSVETTSLGKYSSGPNPEDQFLTNVVRHQGIGDRSRPRSFRGGLDHRESKFPTLLRRTSAPEPAGTDPPLRCSGGDVDVPVVPPRRPRRQEPTLVGR